MKKQLQKETRYEGYFLMDSGLKVEFDVSEEENGKNFEEMFDCRFPYEKDDLIWLGKSDNSFLLADRVIGFAIDTYEEEIE